MLFPMLWRRGSVRPRSRKSVRPRSPYSHHIPAQIALLESRLLLSPTLVRDSPLNNDSLESAQELPADAGPEYIVSGGLSNSDVDVFGFEAGAGAPILLRVAPEPFEPTVRTFATATTNAGILGLEVLPDFPFRRFVGDSEFAPFSGGPLNAQSEALATIPLGRAYARGTVSASTSPSGLQGTAEFNVRFEHDFLSKVGGEWTEAAAGASLWFNVQVISNYSADFRTEADWSDNLPDGSTRRIGATPSPIQPWSPLFPSHDNSMSDGRIALALNVPWLLLPNQVVTGSGVFTWEYRPDRFIPYVGLVSPSGEFVAISGGDVEFTATESGTWYVVVSQNGRLDGQPAEDGRPMWRPYELQVTVERPTDIIVLSATTADSQSVTYEYEIIGEPIPEVTVGIYRSADDKFDPDEDVLLGEDIIANAVSNTRTWQGVVGLDPERPYVLVVADPASASDQAGKIREVDESNNVASFQKQVFGIVTHGFTPPLLPLFPEWIFDMEQSLRLDNGYTDGRAFSWVEGSGLPFPNQTVLAGSDMAAVALELVAHVDPSIVVDLHFIGHSRGSVVISEALKVLSRLPESSVLRQRIEQGYVKMTMLDPHPAHNHWPPHYSAPLLLGSKLGPLTWAVHLGLFFFQEAAADPETSRPSLADDLEVFYQRTPWYQTLSPLESVLNLWGELPIAADRVRDLTGFGMTHTRVVDWYQNNVVRAGLAASQDASSGQHVNALGLTATADGISVESSDGPSDLEPLFPALVQNRGVAMSMLRQLGAAQSAFERGNTQAAIGALNAFVRHVEAQRGKSVQPDAADFFVQIAEWAIIGISETGRSALAAPAGGTGPSQQVASAAQLGMATVSDIGLRPETRRVDATIATDHQLQEILRQLLTSQSAGRVSSARSADGPSPISLAETLVAGRSERAVSEMHGALDSELLNSLFVDFGDDLLL